MKHTEACPHCGSDCNERDELVKAEREIELLRAENAALLAANKDCFSHFDALRAELEAARRQEPEAWEFKVAPYADHGPASGLRRTKEEFPFAIPSDRISWSPLYAAPVPAEPSSDLNLSDRAVQKRLAAQWGFVPADERVPEWWQEFLKDLTQRVSEAGDHTQWSFHREMVRLANRAHKMLAAAPKPEGTGHD